MKTLAEPPPARQIHFATTDGKRPITICPALQRFDFPCITSELIVCTAQAVIAAKDASPND